MAGSVILAMVLALRTGFQDMVWPGAPLAMTSWMASRIVFLVCLYEAVIRSGFAWLFIGLVPLVAMCVSRRFLDERPSGVTLGAALIALLALTVFVTPAVWLYGVQNAPSVFCLYARATATSPYVWFAIVAFIVYLVLGRGLARTRSVAPLLFWDALATGVALLIIMTLDTVGPFEIDTTLIVAAAVILAVVRSLWFRALVMTTLPKVALVEFAMLAAINVRDLYYIHFPMLGFPTWSVLSQHTSFFLLFVIPGGVLLREILLYRRGRYDTLRAFD